MWLVTTHFYKYEQSHEANHETFNEIINDNGMTINELNVLNITVWETLL